MANWDSMTLRSDNKEKFTELMEGFDPKTSVREQEHNKESGEVYFSASPLPDEAVKELSAQHPDMTFTARCSFEHDMHTNVYKVEYKAGVSSVIDIETNYLWPSIQYPECATKDIDALMEKITQVFRRIDPVVGDGNEMTVDSYPYDVTVCAENGDFKMEATKCWEEVVDVKMFRKKQTFTWEHLQAVGEDVPF